VDEDELGRDPEQEAEDKIALISLEPVFWVSRPRTGRGVNIPVDSLN